MSFRYGQGYPSQGGQFPGQHLSAGGPTPGGTPVYGGGPVHPQSGPFGGMQPPTGLPPGGQLYGGVGPGGGYFGGQAPGVPYGGYSQQLPRGNIPHGVNPEAYEWFQSVDTDHSGYITLKELRQALVNSNWSAFNDETCLMMINMFDKTRSGRMDVFGFSALWMFMQQWRSVFQQYDRDRSGSICSNELHQALAQMGYNLSPQFTQCLASRYSTRGSPGSLQLDRFIQVCTQLQSMTEAFREKDASRTGNVRMSYEDFLSATIVRLM